MLCSRCKLDKSIDSFGENSFYSRGYDYYCKDCRSSFETKYRHNNKEKSNVKVEKYKTKNRKECRDKYWQYLLTHPCVDCGESDPIVLEMDHLRDKKYNVATLIGVGSYKWDTIQTELDKCVSRCVNCHRIKTIEEGNWWRSNDYV